MMIVKNMKSFVKTLDTFKPQKVNILQRQFQILIH